MSRPWLYKGSTVTPRGRLWRSHPKTMAHWRIHGSRPIKVFNTATFLTNFHKAWSGCHWFLRWSAWLWDEARFCPQMVVFVRVRIAFCLGNKHWSTFGFHAIFVPTVTEGLKWLNSLKKRVRCHQESGFFLQNMALFPAPSVPGVPITHHRAGSLNSLKPSHQSD